MKAPGRSTAAAQVRTAARQLYIGNATGRNCTTNKLSTMKSLRIIPERNVSLRAHHSELRKRREYASRKIKCQINADDKFAGRTSDADVRQGQQIYGALSGI